MSTAYEFRLGGHLEEHWTTAFGELILRHHHDGTSTLTGQVADQAQLHGILATLRDMGAPLISLRALPMTVDMRPP
jgi:hypothetical protein